MSVTAEIEKLRAYPGEAPAAFREQLERAGKAAELLAPKDRNIPRDQGIDRSREFAPVAKPVILRTLSA